MVNPMTTAADIPLWQQIRQKAIGSTDCAFWMAVADEVKRLTLSATASEKHVQELEMQSRGNWIDAEQLAAVIRHAVWEADNQAGVIDVDKLRAAMEKANG